MLGSIVAEVTSPNRQRVLQDQGQPNSDGTNLAGLPESADPINAVITAQRALGLEGSPPMAENPSEAAEGARGAIDLSGNAILQSEVVDMVEEETADAELALPELKTMTGRVVKRTAKGDFMAAEQKRGRK